MSRRVLIFDTSVLCCWLQVPGKETAGPADDRWDYQRIQQLIEAEKIQGSTFVLPLASLIETGNHIAQSSGDRFTLAQRFAAHFHDAADAKTPWAAFADQSELWQPAHLKRLAEDWPALAASQLSLGDATIKDVAEHYAKAGFAVEILTGDGGLKAYQPIQPVFKPRRRGG